MQPQPAERKTPPNVLPFGPAREPFIPIPNQSANDPVLEIHDHELVRRVGRGSYGEVWLARSALGTFRAIKIVYRKDFEDSRPFEREFAGIQKFEPISRSHPGLVNILHVGRRQDYFYYVMELADAAKDPNSEFRNPKEARSPKSEPAAPCDDTQDSASALPSPLTPRPSDLYRPRTLREDLRQNGRLPAAQCVEIGLALTSALAHLHRHGLVHRDVKPSNIIFVHGAAKLADIGLVTEAGDSRSIVGTEGYLPPEGPGTPQADIFALGKVLYEAATGLDRREFPNFPPEIRAWPDAKQVFELNEALLKACAKDSTKRYRSVESMMGELQRLRRGKSIRRARQVERGWRLARRGAVVLTATAAILSLILSASRVRQLTAVHHPEGSSTNAVANQFYEMGKAHFRIFNGTNFQMAASCFQNAIQADPHFPEAYGYLAATYFWGGFDDWNPKWELLPRAKEVARQALALDPSLAEPHLALAWYHAMREWNWRDAEREDRRAVELKPASFFCHLCYAEFLRMAGRMPEALKEIGEATARNPDSRVINARLIHYLICARRFDDALAQIDRAVAMEAGGDPSWDRRDIYLAKGDSVNAIEAERTGRITSGEPREEVERDLAELKGAANAQGIKAIWRHRLENDKQRHDAYYVYDEARCYAQLGDTNAALACLEKLLNEHDTMITFNIMTDWMLDPIRSAQHFHAILNTMRLE